MSETTELTSLRAENAELKRQMRNLEASLAEARQQRDQAARALEGAGAVLSNIAAERRDALERLNVVQRELWALQLAEKRRNAPPPPVYKPWPPVVEVLEVEGK